MATADDVNAALAENATGPKRAAADGVTVEQHSLADQIRAHKHLKQLEAIEDTADAGGGIRFTRLISPGTA